MQQGDDSRGRKRRPVAVALRDDRPGTDAPAITATGRGAFAEKILEIAFANGIPVREDADLAEILGALEEESRVPVGALAAVTEILSYVYRLNRRFPPEETAGAGEP